MLFFYDFAEFAAAQRRDERALRLSGAGTALKDRTGTQLADFLRVEDRPSSLEVLALLGRAEPARKDALGAAGAALTDEEAIAFALSERDAPWPLAAGAGLASASALSRRRDLSRAARRRRRARRSRSGRRARSACPSPRGDD